MAIIFQNADVKFRPTKGKELAAFIEKQVKKEAQKKLHIDYIFCSDEYLLNINREFLEHDFYTDIITFPLVETDEEVEAEIYISVDRVKDNAQKLKIEFDEEMQRVLFHGVLHLIGFNDKTKTEEKVMRKKENEWIQIFNSQPKPR